jgi:hypothetical protein
MGMGNRFYLRYDLIQAGFIAVLLLTLLNGLFVSLAFEFLPPPNTTSPPKPHHWTFTRGTFLADPTDVRADLIKLDFSFPPLIASDLTNWPAHYRKLVLHSPYKSFDLRQRIVPDRFSGLHVPPLYVLLAIATKKLILDVGPSAVVHLNDAISVAALAGTCWLFIREWRGSIFTFIVLGLSSPFLNVVSRANQGALLTGILLAGFVYTLCVSPNFIAAALLLALACNFRPNAVILSPLLLCLGWRRFFLALPFFAGMAAGCFLLAERITERVYPGYTLAAFFEGLLIYYHRYVVYSDGNVDNNSVFGAFKMIYVFFTGQSLPPPSLLSHANTLIFIFFTGLFLGSMVLFHLKRISALEFIFLGLACYMLTSTIFATYHLLPFVALPLLFYRHRLAHGFSIAEGAIFFGVLFLLCPKNYVHVHRVSLETVLNPLAIAAIFLYVWIGSLWPRREKQPTGTPSPELSHEQP